MGQTTFFDTIEDFFRAYAKMRDAQTKYFKTRSVDDLNTAKRLERELDNAVLEHVRNKAKEQQARLF